MSIVVIHAIETIEKKAWGRSHYPMPTECIDYSEMVRVLDSCGDGKDETRYFDVKSLPNGVKERTEWSIWL